MKEDYKELIDLLNKASYAYYNTEKPIMTDKEFDKKFEQLKRIEEESGIILSNSPTQHVGAPVLDVLDKVSIIYKPMLSLEKCHSAKEVLSFGQNKRLIAMIKCDGLSVRLRYDNGELIAANTRGNGYEGSDITEHVKHFKNVPLTIPYQGVYIIDGEAVILDKDFQTLTGFKNNRNTASGALALLDTKEVENRKLSFIAWDVIDGGSSATDLYDNLMEASAYGFEVVPFIVPPLSYTEQEIDEYNQDILRTAKEYGIPCDGVVWKFANIEYGKSLGKTSHHFNNGIAWKPQDETAETILLDVEWTMGRTGQLTPVAILKPVELDGSVIERASLHNISIMNELGIKNKGDIVSIYKANAIIPQVLEVVSLAEELNPIEIPTKCPICGGNTIIKKDNDSEVLFCINADCEGKAINQFDHFCGKKGLDIKHLSKATLEKLMNYGWLNEYEDIFKLKEHREEWMKKPGFGPASVDRLLSSIEDSKKTTLNKVIAATGIPLIGATASKQLAEIVDSWEDFRAKTDNNYNWMLYDNIGEVMCDAINHFDYSRIDKVIPYLTIEKEKQIEIINQFNYTFVITGKTHIFKNRTELTADIQSKGGKVSSSVSKNVDYLINNDISSTSSKNLKAKELGIPIITEEEYQKLSS